MNELYKKYRPKKLSQIVGQPEAVSLLQGFGKKDVPHAILFSGPSGTGKTTLARIMAKVVGCLDHELEEVNAASSRGIEAIREIDRKKDRRPLGGHARVWILDEAHQLTKKDGGDAQTALLKILEDQPEYAYFFLCTTHPQKLLPTVVNRCSAVKLRAVSQTDLNTLVEDVAKKEGITLSDRVKMKLTDAADGSPRRALVLLEQVGAVLGEEAQLGVIERGDTTKAGIDLCRLLANKQTKWDEVQKMLKDLDEEPETVRRIVLGYFTSILLSAKGPIAARAAAMIDLFRDHYYDCGKAGLVASCFAAVHDKR